MEDIERERQREQRREMDRQACTDFVKQQMWETELMRRQQKLEKQREIEEWAEKRKQYEKDQMMFKQKQHEEKMGVRNTYRRQISEKNVGRADEARKEAKEEQCRRQFDTEKEQWTKTAKDKETERYRRRQRRSEMVGDKLLVQEQKKANKEEEIRARALARAAFEHEAKLVQEQNRKNESSQDLWNAMAAQRESRHRQREEKARDDKQRGRDELHTLKEKDRIYWENQRLIAERKKADRLMMDDALRQQIANKCFKEEREKQEKLEYERRHLELLEEEEEQFQRYAGEVINAASEAKRNPFSLRKAAEKDIAAAVGPITGGFRANCLAPGANYSDISKYLKTTSQDINRLYGTSNYEPTKARLGFIW
ncbi:coiled-coil domain-containing protein 173-like [Megalops cyprinoides]|uniref:coiled-coil domain-containing protein 173-like n=1 Tax=Megalops cyprinoides TaxID=118141 RepID=UPI00186450A6|nr:coiled-coil domain-containing protein 173-like [Megalops cyprinoides]